MASRVLEKLKWGDSYTVRILSRELKMDKGAVQKELYRLMDEGIVERREKQSRRSRAIKHFQKRGYRYVYFIPEEKLQELRTTESEEDDAEGPGALSSPGQDPELAIQPEANSTGDTSP